MISVFQQAEAASRREDLCDMVSAHTIASMQSMPSGHLLRVQERESIRLLVPANVGQGHEHALVAVG